MKLTHIFTALFCTLTLASAQEITRVSIYAHPNGTATRTQLQEAANLGKALAENKFEIVALPAKSGPFGQLIDAALAHGGQVTGLVVSEEELSRLSPDRQAFIHKQTRTDVTKTIPSHFVTGDLETVSTDNTAFILLPGGTGAITTFMLRFQQKMTNQSMTFPLIIVNIDGFWDPLIEQLEAILSTVYSRNNFSDLVTVVKTAAKAVAAIKASNRSNQP